MSNENIPRTFRGMLWEPGSEQEVIFLFGVMLDHLPWPIAIDEIRCAYPDCLAHRTDTQVPLRIEFELYGSNFRDHGHDASGCDVVVCWMDDLRDWPEHIEVVELSKLVSAKRTDLILRSRPKKVKQLWGEDKFHAHADARVSAFIRELHGKISATPMLSIPYDGMGADATCNVMLVGHNPGILWIWADGRYQWCWQGFRVIEPKIVELFQRIVGSDNKSSYGEMRVGAILMYTTDEIAEKLITIANAVLAG